MSITTTLTIALTMTPLVGGRASDEEPSGEVSGEAAGEDTAEPRLRGTYLFIV